MKKLLLALAAVAVFGGLALAGIKDSDVDSTGPDFTKKMICPHIQGQLTADVAGKVKFVNLEAWKLLAVKATCRARSGAAGDATFDVTAGGSSVLSAKVACDTGGTTASATLGATTTFAAGTVWTIDWDRNNSGTADDCDVCIYYRSKVATESF